MGKLIWHEWGRLVAMAAATYMAWGSFWAFFFRKFFWDMIGGELGPAGIIPGPNTALFVIIVVMIPLLQIFNMLLAIFTLALEWPMPFFRGTAIHRSLGLRVGLYFLTAFLGIMVYQTVDCAVYFFIASLIYLRSIVLAERIPEETGKSSSAV